MFSSDKNHGRRVSSTFTPPWWLKNPHLQTMVASHLSPCPTINYRRERVELDDGDFVDLDWGATFPGRDTVLILHGLEGSSQSSYARRLVHALGEARLNAVVMNFRGCSGELNRLNRAYTAGDTGDLKQVWEHVTSVMDSPSLHTIGYSLGGNLLLKFLAEISIDRPIIPSAPPEKNALKSAVAVSVPYQLGDASARMEQGLSRLYQAVLLRHLHRSAKLRSLKHPPVLTHNELKALNTFARFDDKITAPLHDYSGVEEYYTTASSRQYLRSINPPTLLLHAEDDPFMFPETLPREEELSPNVTLKCSTHGGHVGFICRHWKQPFWLQTEILAWLEKHGAKKTQESP